MTQPLSFRSLCKFRKIEFKQCPKSYQLKILVKRETATNDDDGDYNNEDDIDDYTMTISINDYLLGEEWCFDLLFYSQNLQWRQNISRQWQWLTGAFSWRFISSLFLFCSSMPIPADKIIIIDITIIFIMLYSLVFVDCKLTIPQKFAVGLDWERSDRFLIFKTQSAHHSYCPVAFLVVIMTKDVWTVRHIDRWMLIITLTCMNFQVSKGWKLLGFF